MILETIVIVDTLLLIKKAIYTKVIDKSEVHNKIVNEGLYHLTTMENAIAIMESGYIKPSNSLISMGREKCFFFPGLPSYINLCINTANYANKYEIPAIKIRINESELNSLKQRSFADNIIVYEGKCVIPRDRTEIVSLVLDFDKDHNIIVREKGIDEVYQPSEELVKELKLKEGYINTLKNLLKGYVREVKDLKTNIFNLTMYSYKAVKDKLNRYTLVKENHELVSDKLK